MIPSKFAPAPFDGKRFSNLSGRPPNSTADVLRWMRSRHKPEWPKHIANQPAPKPLDRVNDGSIRVTLIGHATVLLQVAGVNIVTDPIWSDRAGPTSWLGSRRVRAPAIPFADMPKIDAVLLSHNHYDHLDRPTLKALARRDAPLIVTGLGVGRSVPSDRVTELDWWQSHPLSPSIRATYVPAEHFSARTPFDRNKSLWGGFVLETPAGVVYFAADSAAGPHFAMIRERFGPMDLALFPIGAYAPRWFMSKVHMDPAEAVTAAATCGARVNLPIHYGVFPLADDPCDEPAMLLAKARASCQVEFPEPKWGQPIVVRK